MKWRRKNVYIFSIKMCPLLLCDFCSPNTLSTSVVRALSGGVFPLLCWVPHIYLPPSRFANVWSWENARPFKLPPLLFVWDQNFPPNTLAEKLFWFLFLMDVGVFAVYSLGLPGCLPCQCWEPQEGVPCGQCTHGWGGPRVLPNSVHPREGGQLAAITWGVARVGIYDK